MQQGNREYVKYKVEVRRKTEGRGEIDVWTFFVEVCEVSSAIESDAIESAQSDA